jgi:hypothetical protein
MSTSYGTGASPMKAAYRVTAKNIEKFTHLWFRGKTAE